MTPPMCPRVSTWHSHHLGPHFSHRPRPSTWTGPACCKPIVPPPFLLLLLLLLSYMLLLLSGGAGSGSVLTSFLGSGVHPGAATHGIHRGLSMFLGQSCRCDADSAQSRKVIGAPRSAFLVSVSMTSLASPSVANCANAVTSPRLPRISCSRSMARWLTLRWFVKSRSTLFGNVSRGYPYRTTLRQRSVGSTSTRPGTPAAPGPPAAPRDRRCSPLVLGGD
mmetsp:Transcript_5326/g.23751  ORF Transcript_5326/g.23751 Transcript_5326/m.23751 type:complete len:221 (+) Transcript_5326:1978-2640(+)